MQCDWPLLGPLRWLHYVNKQVKVRTGKGDEHSGWLLSVDPVSASAVLLTFSETAASVRVVMGHAVKEVEVLREADEVTAERLRAALLPPSLPSLDPEELRRRRGGVRRWLQENRVPVEEQGEQLTVAGVLTITAPYTAEDCSSSNQIILDRIQRLIRTQN
ncbi:gem-associated protein 6 [Archocentrus centrarchus]|uniref:gem-associated protein 6 n=1 Tax=Archocentrus centrarchus TaxID=63155 RepID=UPI0011EA1E7A|nr:gem-associated protein 6 [Archocentrus centrarchus]